MSPGKDKPKNKLLYFFTAFSEKDWDGFALFLDTPLFNSNPDIFRLYTYYRDNYREMTKTSNWKQKVFAYVFPDTPYKDGQLRTLFWRMGKLLESYLAVTNLLEDEQAREAQLIKALDKRNEWFGMFEKRIYARINANRKQAVDFSALLESVQLHHQLYFHDNFGKYGSGDLEIQVLIEDLNKLFVLGGLKYFSEFLARRQILKAVGNKVPYFKQVLEQLLINAEHFSADPTISSYAKMIHMRQTMDLDVYREVKAYFEKKRTEISEEDQRWILIYLINFIIFANKRQTVSLFEEALSLYQLGLDSGILIRENRITYGTFTNIAVAGSIEKRFAWTDVFIRDYSKYLEPTKANLAIRLARAFWCFHQGDFEQVLDWTQKIDMGEGQPDHPFRLRALKLRAYYELYMQDKSYYKLLSNSLESFTKFIKNEGKIARHQALAYLNFVRLTKKLFNKQVVVGTLSDEQKEKLREKINTTNPLIMKGWLDEKINNG